MKASARAHSNIALIKYWGKRNSELKLPHNGSISLTLDALYTDTEVHFSSDFEKDQLWLDGNLTSDKASSRVTQLLDRFRHAFHFSEHAQIKSQNSFPTAAGLASSASGFAALVASVNQALNLQLSPQELSLWARLGSGSASRSIFGGFVEWKRGENADGTDSFASPIATPDWDVAMVVLVLNPEEKAVSSSIGMQRTVDTSPLYAAWLEGIEQDLCHMRKAIQSQNFETVGQLMEHNALKMHATALAAQPAVLYWSPASVQTIHWVQHLREQGLPVYLTMDAGPNVKLLVKEKHLSELLKAIETQGQIQESIVCRPGPGVSSKSQ